VHQSPADTNRLIILLGGPSAGFRKDRAFAVHFRRTLGRQAPVPYLVFVARLSAHRSLGLGGGSSGVVTAWRHLTAPILPLRA